jgi:DNA ligase (NAD+)
MVAETVVARADELRRDLRAHDHAYYVLTEPSISDAEYDALLDELRALETSYPELITSDSPTQRIGAEPAEGFTKVEHPAPILSLDKATSGAEIESWWERVSKLVPADASRPEWVVEPKLDGLTVVLHYEDGLFTLGATRGDGYVGEDVTTNLRTLRSLPLRIPVNSAGPRPPHRLIVRGEALMLIDDFEKLNQREVEAGRKPFANPRNAAAGSLRQLSPSVTASRPIALLCYALIQADGVVPETQWDTLEYLSTMGFPVSRYRAHFDSLPALVAYCEHWVEMRDAVPYEVDGLVIKVNHLKTQEALGVAGRAPRGAVAFKFPGREATTRLLDIGVNVGRTGALTPYAVLEPVRLGGVTIKKATLHNFDDLARKDIRVGDRVTIRRAGDVIPYVVGPVVDARTGGEKHFAVPKYCPSCGEPVASADDAVGVYCTNVACPEQLLRRVAHFAALVDIVGLGEQTAKTLVERGLVTDAADLYFLKKDDLLLLDGYAEKSVDGLLSAIKASKNAPLRNLIAALGIRGVGVTVAQMLAQRYASVDDLARAPEETLEGIPGVGPHIAGSVSEWLGRVRNRAFVEKLRQAGVRLDRGASVVTEKGVLDGLTFVLTGTLPSLSRAEATDLIRRHGGRVTGSVSSTTSYLLVGDTPGAAKASRARQLGVPTIGGDELLAMIASRSRAREREGEPAGG